jgi:hypothetical protein
MDVSINYPWGNHVIPGPPPAYRASPGWDFGTPPAGWGVPLRGGGFGGYWRLHLGEDLRLFHRLGIKAVRFALLFNGLLYGVNNDIPTQSAPSAQWEFRPVALTERFLQDFRALVTEFASFNTGGIPNLTLMPVIFGFEFVEDPYVNTPPDRPPRNPDPRNPAQNDYADFFDSNGVRYRAGRRGAVLNIALRVQDGRTYNQVFLDEVVGRLLSEFQPGRPLANYRNVIHSWDLCGEPEGFTVGPREQTDTRRPISNVDMLNYLTNGMRLVQRNAFHATVGFRFLHTIRNWGWHLPHHLEQFHTYDGERLPRVGVNSPALIGETATTVNWPDRLGGSPFDPDFRYRGSRAGERTIALQDRLEWFEYKGYREVFLWSGGRGAPDNRHRWTSAEQDQVERFARLGERRRLFERVP